MTEQTLREQICLIGRLMHERGYVDGKAGNISARLPNGDILTTPSGLCKGFMTPGQLIVVNMDGERVDEPTEENRALRPTSELGMHLECFFRRPDVHGVVHAHPPMATALTVAGIDLALPIMPESVIVLGLIPTAPYATPGSPESRQVIADLAPEHDIIMLQHHGSLTLASNVWDAYLRLETLEQHAKVLYLATQIGSPKTIPAGELEKLIAIRERLGLMRQGDRERFQVYMRAQTLDADGPVDPGS